MSFTSPTAVRPAGVGRWVPYRNLVYYAHAVDRQVRVASVCEKMSVEEVSRRAERQANVMLRASFVPEMLDKGRPWDILHDKSPRAGRHVVSPSFSSLLSRPGHASRRALDEISLAYWAAGFGYAEVLARTYLDYTSIGGSVVSVTLRDVAVFLQFYWNWRVDRDWREQTRFVDQFGSDPETQFVSDIFHGRASIDDVRIEHRVNEGFDASGALRRLARNLLHAAEAGSRELNRLRITENNEFLKHGGLVTTLAVATQAALAAARAEADIAESAASTKTLQDYIESEMASDDFKDEPPTVESLQMIGVSPNDLYLENAGGNDEPPLFMLTDSVPAGTDDAPDEFSGELDPSDSYG